MSESDSKIALEDTLTAVELIRAVMAQKDPTAFEVALVCYIEDLENRLADALNDLSTLHGGKKGQSIPVLDETSVPEGTTLH